MAFMAKAYDFLAPHLEKVPVYFTAEGSIVAMFAIIYLSKFAHAFLSLALLQAYDNVQASFRYGGGAKTWQQKTVQRAYSAHQNHWEAFAGFSVAMILAIMKNPTARSELALLGNAFLLVRAAYNLVYIVSFNEILSMARSSTFMVGIIITVRLFTIAVGM